MWKGVLPVGSVVLLKEGDRKLMVTGICVTKEDDGDDPRVFDYCGVLYPDGFEDPEKLFLFNRESIEQVYHVGYIDEETEAFMPNIEKMLDAEKRGSV